MPAPPPARSPVGSAAFGCGKLTALCGAFQNALWLRLARGVETWLPLSVFALLGAFFRPFAKPRRLKFLRFFFSGAFASFASQIALRLLRFAFGSGAGSGGPRSRGRRHVSGVRNLGRDSVQGLGLSDLSPAAWCLFFRASWSRHQLRKFRAEKYPRHDSRGHLKRFRCKRHKRQQSQRMGDGETVTRFSAAKTHQEPLDSVTGRPAEPRPQSRPSPAHSPVVHFGVARTKCAHRAHPAPASTACIAAPVRH